MTEEEELAIFATEQNLLEERRLLLICGCLLRVRPYHQRLVDFPLWSYTVLKRIHKCCKCYAPVVGILVHGDIQRYSEVVERLEADSERWYTTDCADKA